MLLKEVDTLFQQKKAKVHEAFRRHPMACVGDKAHPLARTGEACHWQAQLYNIFALLFKARTGWLVSMDSGSVLYGVICNDMNGELVNVYRQ